MSTVQLFGREARNFATFSHVNGQHRQANVDQVFYYAAFYPAIEVVSALSSALIPMTRVCRPSSLQPATSPAWVPAEDELCTITSGGAI